MKRQEGNLISPEKIVNDLYVMTINLKMNIILYWNVIKSQLCQKYIKPYYYRNPSSFKLAQLLSVCNVKELNNLDKYLFLAENARNF